MRVLHVVSVDKPNYFLNNLCDYSNGVEYVFVTLAPQCGFAEALRQRGKRVHCLSAQGRRDYPRAAWDIRRIIRAEQPDIVHTHLFDPTMVGATVAKLQGRKVVVTRHHSDALYQLPLLKRRLYLTLERYVNHLADHIVAPARAVRDILLREGVRPEKVSLIPYGQTCDRFDLSADEISRVRAELGMDGLSLVCNARLFHRKGHAHLFAAFARLRADANLYLVGTGNYQAPLEALARELGIARRVKFLGWRDDALAVVAAADVIVHPSLEDALSSALIEALMLRKPIIATDISGARDILADGRYGWIVPPADPDSLHQALQSVVDDLPAARARAAGGRDYLLRYMGARRVAEEYVKVYHALSLP